MLKRFSLLSAVLLCLVLAACGGGGGKADTFAAASGVQYSQGSSVSHSSSAADAAMHSPTHAGKAKGKEQPQARFNGPAGIAFDADGNLYVADSRNYTIRKLSADGAVTTIAGTPGERGSADGTGAAARFFQLMGLAVGPSGDIFVTDGSVVRKITPAGEVSTLAGVQGQFGNADGQGSAARFRRPSGIAVDADGNVYVTDFFEYTVRKITPDGRATTLAGANPSNEGPLARDGIGAAARFMGPGGLAIDASGNLYVADIAGVGASIPVTGSTLIRKVDRNSGAVSTIAGNLGLGTTPSVPGAFTVAELEDVFGIVVDRNGNILAADHLDGGNRIRQITPSGEISTIAQDDSSAHGLLDLALDAQGRLFASDFRDNVIVRITQDGNFEVVAGERGVAGSADGPTGQDGLCRD